LSSVESGKRSLLLAGYYGAGNAGDEAILGGLLADLRRLAPDQPVVVASADPQGTHRQHGVPAVHRDDVPSLVQAMRGCAAVALSGGVLNDYWPVPLTAALGRQSGGLPFYVSYAALSVGADAPSMLCGVGVGPLDTEEGRELARAGCILAARATVRDAASLEALRAAGLDPGALARVEVTADPAWSLPTLPVEALPALLEELGLSPDERPVGLALRTWERDDSRVEAYVEAVAEAFEGAFDSSVGALLLSFDSADEDVHRRLAERLGPSRRLVTVAGREPAALGALLGRCRVVLAMRYHAALLSSAAGAPVVALAYDPKVEALFADLGMPDLALPPAAWTASAVRDALERAPVHRARAELTSRLEQLQRRARRNAESLLAVAAMGPDREPGRRLLGHLLLEKTLAAWRAESLAESLASTQTTIDQLHDEVARDKGEVERLRQEIAHERDALESLRDELAQRGREAERLREQRAQLREQRSFLMAERALLERRLDELLGTVGYRVLGRFWALMRRSFPEGSRRRRLYRWSRDLAARVVGEPGAGAAGVQPISPWEDEAEPTAIPDARAQLVEFADRVLAGGARLVVAIVSGTPLLESEGQRPTRLALALARRGVPVVFAYWRWSEQEWRPQDRLEEGILQLPLDLVARQPEPLLGAFPGLQRLLMLELPWPGAFVTLAGANAAGWITVYDALDDWAEFQRVGQADWYDEPFEQHVLAASDAVFAVNAPLAERLRALGAPGVQVLANGVDVGIARVSEPRPLQRGEVTIGYFGYLAAAWFDWGLIAEAARRRPGWRFYLIGYGAPEGVELPANVELLGRQPHSELAAFARSWDVAVVPFKPERLAAGADPIKTYEYLALGLPVVVTGAGVPEGAESLVWRAGSVDDFLEAIATAARSRGSGDAAREEFARGCTWDRRVDALLEAVDQGTQRIAEKRALCGL
jgi:polysaccharide pyruvyl transferase CsaB